MRGQPKLRSGCDQVAFLRLANLKIAVLRPFLPSACLRFRWLSVVSLGVSPDRSRVSQLAIFKRLFRARGVSVAVSIGVSLRHTGDTRTDTVINILSHSEREDFPSDDKV